MFVPLLDAGFVKHSEKKGIIQQIKESSSEMEVSQALTYKLLKTLVLRNTNETLAEQAPSIQTHKASIAWL